jgi:hypothetical protein
VNRELKPRHGWSGPTRAKTHVMHQSCIWRSRGWERSNTKPVKSRGFHSTPFVARNRLPTRVALHSQSRQRHRRIACDAATRSTTAGRVMCASSRSHAATAAFPMRACGAATRSMTAGEDHVHLLQVASPDPPWPHPLPFPFSSPFLIGFE